jgi:cytochrome c553
VKFRKIVLLLVAAVLVFAGYFGVRILLHGFTTAAEPSHLETIVARAARNFAIPRKARLEPNPWKATPDVLKDARESYIGRCVVCHAPDGSGQTNVGPNLYPRVPDLRLPQTQNLTDGQLRYIIRSGVPLTGMPGWAKPHDEQSDDSWKLVLFIRSLGSLTKEERAQQVSTISSYHFTGSASCQKCHAQIYEHWRKTPMANVVRDPRESPNVIIPDLSTNKIAKFTKDDVALVYGSVWKQRYFTKIGDDYYPEPAQWDVTNKVWRPYFVPNGADWWVPFYPPDNMQRPTGPHLRRLPLRRLRHPHQASRRVERRLRTLPRPRQRARSASNTRQYFESRSHGLRPGQRHLHPVPFPGAPAHRSHRR